MNIFTPIFRTHEGNRPKDNVQFDSPEVIDEFATNSRLYAELKPYRDFVYNEYYEKHIPMMRPLFFHFAEEEAFVNKREFLFGRDVLVAPVMREKQESWKVYLPKEKWVQFFTGKEFEGDGWIEIPSPLGLPIAFYRKDSEFAPLFSKLSTMKGE